MAIDFRILLQRGLVYVRYEGMINAQETGRALAQYAAHPDHRPGQRQLVDLAATTGWDRDFAKMMELQSKKVDSIHTPGSETLFVYYAPDALTQSIAQWVLRSWDQVKGVIPVIQETEAGALAVLGQPEESFAEMLQTAS